jgi:hypothetical protein
VAQSYLDKFRSTLPTTQGNQLLRVLRKKKEDGEIRTVDELRSKLKKLTTTLLEEKIKPTFRLWEAVGKKDISSEKFNEMVERTEDDLETIFTEIDNLYEILDIHGNLIKNVALQIIERGLNKLEAQVSLHEFLNKSNNGFEFAIHDTFRDTAGSLTTRNDDISKFVFTDVRTGSIISAENSAYVDPVGERLILGDDDFYYTPTRNAEHLTGENSSRSELEASFEDSKISNIIDDTRHTYWGIPILLSYIPSSGAIAEVAIDLYSSQDINFIEIEPASPFPMELSAVGYVDSNAVTQYISIDETILDKESVRVDFNKITTSRLVLRFSQLNYNEVQFETGAETSSFKDAVVKKRDVYPDLRQSDEFWKAFSSSFIVEDILGVTSPERKSVRYYEYIIAIDNIRAGRSNYQFSSIYASKKKTIDSIRQIGLSTKEARPTQVVSDLQDGYDQASRPADVLNSSFSYPARSSTQDLNYYHGSIEYWTTVQFLDASGKEVKTHTVPIIPTGATRVYHEKLKFTNRLSTSVLLNDAGSLALYTLADSDDVTVYRDGLELTYGTDWDFVPAGDNSGLTNTTAGNKSRMKRGIQILSRTNLLDNYTVSYCPTFSDTVIADPLNGGLLGVVDLAGDLSLRVINDGLVVVDPDKISSTITKADVYLTILLHRNSTNINISPVVEEFLLAIGTRNAGKFEYE